MKIALFGNFQDFGRNSATLGAGAPAPALAPAPASPRGQGRGRGRPRRRGGREAAAHGCTLCAGPGPPARPLGAKRFRSGAGYAHSGPPIRLLGAKRSRGAHVAPSLLTFAAGSVWCPSVPERSDKTFPYYFVLCVFTFYSPLI